VSLIRLNTTPTDATKPWRGNVAPRTTPAARLDVFAVFVDPASVGRYLGSGRSVDTLFSSCEKVCMIAGDADLSEYNELIDSDSTRWRIEKVQTLKPGNVTLLHFVGVKR